MWVPKWKISLLCHRSDPSNFFFWLNCVFEMIAEKESERASIYAFTSHNTLTASAAQGQSSELPQGLNMDAGSQVLMPIFALFSGT